MASQRTRKSSTSLPQQMSFQVCHSQRLGQFIFLRLGLLSLTRQLFFFFLKKKAYLTTRKFNSSMEYDFCSSGIYTSPVDMPQSAWMASSTEGWCLPTRVLVSLGFRPRWMEDLWQVHSSTFLACLCAFITVLIPTRLTTNSIPPTYIFMSTIHHPLKRRLTIHELLLKVNAKRVENTHEFKWSTLVFSHHQPSSIITLLQHVLSITRPHAITSLSS